MQKRLSFSLIATFLCCCTLPYAYSLEIWCSICDVWKYSMTSYVKAIVFNNWYCHLSWPPLNPTSYDRRLPLLEPVKREFFLPDVTQTGQIQKMFAFSVSVPLLNIGMYLYRLWQVFLMPSIKNAPESIHYLSVLSNSVLSLKTLILSSHSDSIKIHSKRRHVDLKHWKLFLQGHTHNVDSQSFNSPNTKISGYRFCFDLKKWNFSVLFKPFKK